MEHDHTDDNILLLTDRVDGPHAVGVPTNPETVRERDAQVWAYQGVHGGAGVTTVAIQTAYELAESTANDIENNIEVLLIDLDFERGSCAAYLDIQASLSIDELNAASGRMDEALARTFIRKYTKNLSVVVAEGELGGNDYIDPAALLSLLDAVSTMFDYIILDVPLMWRSWTQAVIGAADKFSFVTELSVPSLHKTKELSGLVSNAMELTIPPQIFVNKFERRALRGGVTLKDATQVLDRDDLITLSVDADIIRQSINSGQPAGKMKAESRFAKSVRHYVQNWIEDIHALEAIQETASFELSKSA